MRKLLLAVFIFAVGIIGAQSSFADSGEHKATKLGNLSFTAPWTRATPPNARGGGAFVMIHNNGEHTDTLVYASSDIAKKTEIHEMKVVDGIMKMRPLLSGLEIKAGESVALKPGGYHIMFMGLKGGIKKGDTVNVTLSFAEAGDITLPFIAESMGAKSMSHNMKKGMNHENH